MNMFLKTLVSLSMAIVISAACGGCASESHSASASDTSAAGYAHAECLVCKHEADLACLDVAVGDKTPRATYQGKEYYFCSNDCKKEFEKNPEKYIAHK